MAIGGGVAWKFPTEKDMLDTPQGRIMPLPNYVDVTNEGVRFVICATYTNPPPTHVWHAFHDNVCYVEHSLSSIAPRRVWWFSREDQGLFEASVLPFAGLVAISL